MDVFLSIIPSRTFVLNVIPIKKYYQKWVVNGQEKRSWLKLRAKCCCKPSRYCNVRSLNPIQDGGGGGGGGGGGEEEGKKSLPTSFCNVTSTNVGIRLQNFLTFSLTLFPHWCKVSSPYLLLISNYWTWIKTAPQKNSFFWSNPYETEVML